MHQGSSIIDLAGLAITKTLWKVAVPSWAILLTSVADDHCTHKPASEPPHLASIPTEFLLDGSLAIAGGLGCSPILPLSDCLLLDEGAEQTRGLIAT